jgi:hypothetical protein
VSVLDGSATPQTAARRRAASVATRRIERTICAGYLAAQAVLGVVLWVTYALWPGLRASMQLLPDEPSVTTAFAAPDLAVIVVGSALGAYAVHAGRAFAVPVVAFTAGAVVYPTLYLIGWVAWSGGRGAVGLALMVPVSLLTLWVTYQTWDLFRRHLPDADD